MLQWKEEYSLGLSSIDEQHKKLFEIANTAYDLLKDKLIIDKYDRIIEIIGELQEYTVYHFKTEEEYMQSIGYKKFLSQKAAHNDFLEKMQNIDLDKIDNNQNKYLLEILDFIGDWLVNHIIKQDKLITQ